MHTRVKPRFRAHLVALSAAASVGLAPVTLPAAPLFISNPTGVAGTDVDPAGGQAVVAEFGNLSRATLNADPDQFTLSFDQPAFTALDNLEEVTFDGASEVGQDLTVDFIATNENWFQVLNASRGTSATNGLSLRFLEMTDTNGRFTDLTFSVPMARVGLTISNLEEGDVFSVIFFSDLAGNNELATFVLDSNDNPDVLTTDTAGFFGYENAAGIQRVEVNLVTNGLGPDAFSQNRELDDVSFVLVPEPASLALLGAGLAFVGGRARRR